MEASNIVSATPYPPADAHDTGKAVVALAALAQPTRLTIFRMLVESRTLAADSVQAPIPPIGLEANRKALEMASQWSYEQKIIPRRLSVDELFDDTTAALTA